MPVITRGALRALRLAPGRVVRGEGQRRAAQPVRRPRGARGRRADGMTRSSENPLLEGLQLRRTPEPCVARHLRRLGRPDAAQALPGALLARRPAPAARAASRSSASRAREETDDEFRARMKEAVQQFGRDEFDEDVWDGSPRACATSPTDFADDGGEDRLARLLDRARRASAARRATASTTSPSRRARSRSLVERARRAPQRRTAGRGSIVEKPFGHDLESRAAS